MSAEESGLFVQPFVDEGLGNSAYLVGSRRSGKAALIDPLRDADAYLDLADRASVKVAYALETHLHNDFISGAREVASRTGATVGASASGETAFEHRPLRDGDVLSLGDVTLRVLETPGHTPEHVSYLLMEGNRPVMLFSGGALMVGGAARTDLLGKEHADRFARTLFHTIHDKLLRLPDQVVVYPTHGAGSFCAAPVSEQRTTTIGQERKWNRLAKAATEDEFVRLAAEALPDYPSYFGKVRPINQAGPRPLADLAPVAPLSPEAIRGWAQEGGAVLDVRSPEAFGSGHIPRAYGIPLWAPLIVWGGWIIPFGTPLAVVARSPQEAKYGAQVMRRIGYDDVRGFLDGGMASWTGAGFPVERIAKIAPADLRAEMKRDNPPIVVDVRTDREWAFGHIPGAHQIENGRLAGDGLDLPVDTPIVVHCQTFNRSTLAASILAQRGYTNVRLLDGGFAAWSMWGLETVRGP